LSGSARSGAVRTGRPPWSPLHASELPPQGYPQLAPGIDPQRGGSDYSALSAERARLDRPAAPSEARTGPAALFRRRRKALGGPEQLNSLSGRPGGSGGASGDLPGGGNGSAGTANGARPSGVSGAQEPWAPDAPEERRTFSFGGEKVLIVDDDIRNVFALTSVLEQHGLSVLYAENGREGIEVLEQHDDVTLVLMDIMMPEMDGYATTTAIRRMPQFAGLPIIALTAKAMKGDREKAIDSGASDYVTKPVDPDHLLSVMEQWMHQK
ncbi:response regulator, partial [Streptomyces niveus]|uniref:response regulator n=1 Tax=Streptomyces niveus TaxID=193462 RepID=UPI003426CEB0